MRYFGVRDVREAVRWAAAGGQALHTHPFIVGKAPAPFRRAASRNELIAHLFDWNTARLTETARAFGVNRVFVHHAGTARQHVDLCGGPLVVAARCCETPGEGDASRMWRRSQARLWAAINNKRPASIQRAGSPGVDGKRWEKRTARGVYGWAWLTNTAAADAMCGTLTPESAGYAVVPNELMLALVSQVRARDGNKNYWSRPTESNYTAVIFRTREEAYLALTDAFDLAGDHVVHKLAGVYSERDVEFHAKKMGVADFTVRHVRTFHSEPEPREVRLAFGSQTAGV